MVHWILNFDLFLGWQYGVGCYLLVPGSGSEPQLPARHVTTMPNNRYSTVTISRFYKRANKIFYKRFYKVLSIVASFVGFLHNKPLDSSHCTCCLYFLISLSSCPNWTETQPLHWNYLERNSPTTLSHPTR